MKFIDDKIEHIEDDIEKVQTKTGMYISYLGTKGAGHLGKEIINNAIDECINNNSPADSITITYEKSSDKLTVEDNGRGIPPNDIRIACTKLNSGSKFTREQGGATAGENGVGLTAVNALSDLFEVRVYRADSGMYGIRFEKGKEMGDIKEPAHIKHGTKVSFIPSSLYLGNDTHIPYEETLEWLEKISYLLPNKIKIRFDVFDKLDLLETHKFKTRKLEDYVKANSADMVTDIFQFSSSIDIVETFQNRNIDRTLTLSFVFGYSNSPEPFVDSFCNFINTVDGGRHLDAVKEGIARYLLNQTKNSLTEREKKNMDILWVDILSGLNLVVNLRTDMQMQLGGQTKEKLNNNALFEPIKNITRNALIAYFGGNKDKLAAVVKVIKTNAIARLEANKVKNAVIKEGTTVFSEHRMKKFAPANNGPNQYRELFLIEGDSAMGSAKRGREPNTQAMFAMRGVGANSLKKKRDAGGILDNEEFKELARILVGKWNPREKLDIKKLKYDKIIIMSDADIDGYNISSLIAAFFMKFMPEVILAGKLYKVVSPLYKIDNKKNPFVINKSEYASLYQSIIAKKYKLGLVMRNSNSNPEIDYLKNDRLHEFLLDTKEYLDELAFLANHFGVNKYMLEIILAALAVNDGDFSELYNQSFGKKEMLLNMVQKQFPEITISSSNLISGVIEGKYQSLPINERFIKKSQHMFPIYKKYGYLLYSSEVDKPDIKPSILSIARFLDSAKKYSPKILERYKGLGELMPAELWDTTLNPNNRTLIQFSIDDFNADMEKFMVLHGEGKKYKDLLKAMMKAYKINRDDLDN